jgi:uncharacterized protein YheU (UPF0270 family)
MNRNNEHDSENDVTTDAHATSAEGVEVPVSQLSPETLRNVISEFVTREWEEAGTVSYSLEQKIDQVMSQLESGKARLVFDLSSNTCNIIPVP